MQNGSGFASAAYPLLSGQPAGAFNAQQLISSSTSAVIRADNDPRAPQPQPEASTSFSPATGAKKRARPSQPAAADSPTADGDDEETKARKRRLALSCLNCRHRSAYDLCLSTPKLIPIVQRSNAYAGAVWLEEHAGKLTPSAHTGSETAVLVLYPCVGALTSFAAPGANPARVGRK